jgi:hypothetical protein
VNQCYKVRYSEILQSEDAKTLTFDWYSCLTDACSNSVYSSLWQTYMDSVRPTRNKKNKTMMALRVVLLWFLSSLLQKYLKHLILMHRESIFNLIQD